jgi:hypothetical protein
MINWNGMEWKLDGIGKGVENIPLMFRLYNL